MAHGSNVRTGRAGEDLAAAFLEQNGHEILDRNFKCRCGEIDIISRQDGTFVFSEVKARSSAVYGLPSEAVDYHKRKRISDAAAWYLYHTYHNMDLPCRFDVIAVSGNHCKIYENAFEYCGYLQS